MACGNQSPELENDNRDAYYDIDACPTTPLSLLLKIANQLRPNLSHVHYQLGL